METVTLTPEVEKFPLLAQTWREEDLYKLLTEHEYSLFSCSPEAAMQLGGPLTQEILKAINGRLMASGKDVELMRDYYPVIDCRVQRLMPGMFPSIPGWHCDNVPRGENGQPDLTQATSDMVHYVAAIGTGIPPMTEYLTSPVELSYNESDTVWRELHKKIESDENRETMIQANNSVIVMNSMTPHRATAATCRCVRLFMRLSFSKKPPIGDRRVQETQVYLLSEENGW